MGYSISRRRRGAVAVLMATTSFISLGMIATQAQAADAKPTTVGEVIVTAGKRAENIQKVPASVTAVGGALIDRVQAQNIGDIAAYVPGLVIQNAGVDADRIVIRGLTTGSQDLSPSVGVYLDDAPFGSSTGLALGAIFSPDVDPFDLDRIEVLRGPQGTLYGASTLGGLVKYVTKSPDANVYSGHIRADWGDEDQTGAESYSLRLGANIPIVQDKAAVRVSGFYTRMDGDLSNVRTGQTGLNTTTKQGGRIDLMLKPTEALTVDLIAITDRSDTPHTGLVTGNAVTLQPTYGQYAGYDYIDGNAHSNYSLFEGNIRYHLPDGITATSTTSYSQVRVNEVADDTTVFQPAITAALTPSVGAATAHFIGFNFQWAGPVKPKTDRFTEEVRLTSPSGEKFEWLAGLYYDKENSVYDVSLNSTWAFGATPPAPFASLVSLFKTYESADLTTSYEEYAGFASGSYHVTSDVTLDAGLRYSHNDQHATGVNGGYLVLVGALPAGENTPSSDGVWTESFDAKWQFEPNSMLYARAASGYRPGGPNITGSFQPDHTWNYEVGAKTSALDGKVTADVAAFYIDWTNIQLNFFNGTSTVIGNAGNARSEGVEFEGVYKPIDGLTFAANLTYTDAVMTSVKPGATGGAAVGNTLPNDSKWAGSLRGDYYFPLSGPIEGNFGGALRYRSQFNTTFPGDPGQRFYTLPTTLFADLRAGLSFDKRVNLDFQVLNIADVRKLSNITEELGGITAAQADAYGQPAALTYTPGRTYAVSLTAKF
jgi:iron complex outermembrane receptor protein